MTRSRSGGRRRLDREVLGVVIAVSPLLMAGGSVVPLPAAATGPPPSPCYTASIYESIWGYPTADELLTRSVESAQATVDDLLTREPEIGDDPYFQVNLTQARSEVEGFTALLDVARVTPRPPGDRPLRAVDQHGELLAEVTFDRMILDRDGTYAFDRTILLAMSSDPERDCQPFSAP